MEATPDPVETALEIMETWLDRSRDLYQADVNHFAVRLPPKEVLEAAGIAQARFPDSGQRGFKYFCGVCNTKIKDLELLRRWD